MKPKLLLSDVASINDCSLQNIHKLIKEKGIKFGKESNRIYLQNTDSQMLINYHIPKKIIAIQTVKGGVGKTTIAFSLGIRFWLYGARVLYIDIDQQGNLSKTFGQTKPKYVLQDIFEKKIDPKKAVVSIKTGLDIIPSSIKNALLNQYMLAYGIKEEKAIKNITDLFKNDYDIILIDCPPAIGPAVTAATFSSDLIISPLDPDDYAVDGMKYSLQEVQKLKNDNGLTVDFKILLNKYDARTILSSNIVSQLKKNNIYTNFLFKTIISVSQEFPKSKINNETIFDTLRQGKACKDIDSLAREIFGWPLHKSDDN